MAILYVKCSLLRTGFDSIIYLFTVESVYMHVTSGDVGSGEAGRDPKNIWNPRKNCGCLVDSRHYIAGTLINKSNICIT